MHYDSVRQYEAKQIMSKDLGKNNFLRDAYDLDAVPRHPLKGKGSALKLSRPRLCDGEEIT